MKVLFVSSGKGGSVGEVVKNQGESLIGAGIEVDYLIIKSGLLGYISAIPEIRKTYKRGNYDLIHAHYSLSAYAASLAGNFPLVVSLMGSDIFLNGFLRLTARYFYQNRWKTTIVKTQQMKELLGMDNALIIPNGVDIERFKHIPKNDARHRINYFIGKKLIVFISNPDRPEKNFDLARRAVNIMNNGDVELMPVHNIPNEEIPFYLNAADVLLLTSKWEGSVNVVKEAMACNCPIVSTDVGDIRWVFGDTEGCYITSSEPKGVADNLNLALTFGRRTRGRKRIMDLGLDSESISNRIIHVYNEVSEKGKGNKIRH
jgi:teichuronic acid biosynthesis glycosyltransferase TuaC